MPRGLSWGTPGRAPIYPPLRPAYGLLLVAVLAAGAVTALLLLAQLVGFRGPLSPGQVSTRHAIYDARCQECHAPAKGVPSLRCQRCHDPSAGGRLQHSAHVLFGSLDQAKAAAARHFECARCHVEHRGAELTAVPQGRCVSCHDDPGQVAQRIAGLGRHPEFHVLTAARRQATGLVYSHLTHVTRGKGKQAGYLVLDKQRRADGVDGPAKTCFECHQRGAQDDDFKPLSFEDHCLACHRAELKSAAVEAADVLSAEQAANLTGDEDSVRPEDFEIQGQQLQKVRVQHRDTWVLLNLRRLRSELDPDGFAAEHGALLARKRQIERRLILAQPPAADDLGTLQKRIESTRLELRYIEGRLVAQSRAQPPGVGARLNELVEATALAKDAALQNAAAELAREAGATGPGGAGGLGDGELLERKAELLRLLGAIEKADPSKRGQLDELRRRLEALGPGQSSKELLERARAQRQATLERLDDELQLRQSGTAPPPEALLRGEVQGLRQRLREVSEQLALDDALPPAGPLAPDARARKLQAVASLTAGCRYCHKVSELGAFQPVKAAQPVLWRATFQHRPHLTRGESCGSCHSGSTAGKAWSIETSAASEDLSLRGIESCRECHRPRGARDACLECHRYHPKGAW